MTLLGTRVMARTTRPVTPVMVPTTRWVTPDTRRSQRPGTTTCGARPLRQLSAISLR
jgi:hypothetical protein